MLNGNSLVFRSFIWQWLKSFCTLAYNLRELSLHYNQSHLPALSYSSLFLVFVLLSLSLPTFVSTLLFSLRFCLLLSIKTGYFTFWAELCSPKRHCVYWGVQICFTRFDCMRAKRHGWYNKKAQTEQQYNLLSTVASISQRLVHLPEINLFRNE